MAVKVKSNLLKYQVIRYLETVTRIDNVQKLRCRMNTRQRQMNPLARFQLNCAV